LKRSSNRRGIILVAVLVLALGAFATLAGSAGAVLVKLADGRTVSYLPPARGGALANPFARKDSEPGAVKVSYHGGPVMPASRNYLFVWAPHGLASYPAGYIEGVERFFTDLVHDAGGTQNVESVAAQYGDAEGQHAEYAMSFGGTLVDETAYPRNGCTAAAKCLTEEQLSGELHAYVLAHGLSTNVTSAYFILTPPKVESCFESNSLECSAGSKQPYYCAFHDDLSTTGGPLIFGVDPYAVGIEGCDTGEHPSGLASEGEIQGGLSHEHAEMITDPELNAWYGNGGEIGDLCRTFEPASEFGTPLGVAEDGAPYNQLINGHPYYYQQEWSNEIGGCAQRRSAAGPQVSSLSPRSGAAIGGNTVLINGSSFTGVSEVRFGNVAATKFKVLSATTIEVRVPPGTTGSAAVTVVAEAGSSAPSSSATYKYGAPTITAVSPASGALVGGGAATLSGSGFALGAATTVHFGKAAASSVSCASTVSCTVTVPAAKASGTVDVRATVSGKSSARARPADSYTYN